LALLTYPPLRVCTEALRSFLDPTEPYFTYILLVTPSKVRAFVFSPSVDGLELTTRPRYFLVQPPFAPPSDIVRREKQREHLPFVDCITSHSVQDHEFMRMAPCPGPRTPH